jgi:hypothetical protein
MPELKLPEVESLRFAQDDNLVCLEPGVTKKGAAAR